MLVLLMTPAGVEVEKIVDEKCHFRVILEEKKRVV